MSLVTGMAVLLDANGIGVWQATGIYPDGTLGIYDTVDPHRADSIVLTEYAVSDAGGGLADSVRGIQARIKTAGDDPRPTRNLGHQLFDLLHSRAGFTLDGQYVTLCERQSSAYLGQDSDGHAASHNFYLHITLPTPNRAV